MSQRNNLNALPAVIALRAELVGAAGRDIPARRPRLRLWIGGLLAVGAIAVSPVGAAIADGLAALAGIGDPPSDPRPREAVVIGTGTNYAAPFEVVATGREPGRTAPGADVACVAPEFPGSDAVGASSCLTSELSQALPALTMWPLTYGAPADLGTGAEMLVQGLADPSVTRVDLVVSTDGGELAIPAELSTLSGELSAEIGVTADTRFLLAFVGPELLPEGPVGETLTEDEAHAILSRMELRAFDEDGGLIRSIALDNDRSARLLTLVPPPAD